jgi:hypothetical protein
VKFEQQIAQKYGLKKDKQVPSLKAGLISDASRGIDIHSLER